MLTFVGISRPGRKSPDSNFHELAHMVASERPHLRRYDCSEDLTLFVFEKSLKAQARDEKPTGDMRGPVPFLVGRAFWRDNPKVQPLSTGPIVNERFGEDGVLLGRVFAEALWGDYLLFSSLAGQLCVTRDPKGAIPCFYVVWGSCTIWFSNVADLPAAVRRQLRPDFDVIRLNFYCPKMAKRRTGLAGVNQVMAGSTVLVSDGPLITVENWKPENFIPISPPDLETSAKNIRDSVIEVVSAYGNYFDNPLVSIGGFDSSVIWCIADKFLGRPLNGLSLHSRTERGNERRYVTSLPGLERIAMLPMNGDSIDPEPVFNPNLAVSPPGFVDLIDLTWKRETLGEVSTFDGVLYGIGGDNVFLQAADIYPAGDYVKTNGMTSEAFMHMANSARYAPASIAKVFVNCLQELFGNCDNWQFFLDYSLNRLDKCGYTRDFLADLPTITDLHPGYESIGSAGKGKALQILSSCFCASEFYDMHQPTQFERCELYLSQPILEACLRVPSWMLAYGGVDRGLARIAFADLIPREVLQRTSKSGPEDVYDRFVELHFPRIRDFLSEGVLMREGTVDEGSLTTLFETNPVTSKPRSHRLITLVSNEAWARKWC